MGCVDGKFAKISREVKDQLGNTYYDPDSFKPHLNYGKGYGTFFNTNDDLSFNSLVIYSKDDNFLEREINNFIKNIKKIDVQEILGEGYHLDEHWLHIGDKKPHKYKKGIFTVTITLKEDPNYKITYNNKSKENAKVIVAKNYDPAYDTETEIPLTSYEQEAKEITGWTDALVREYSNLGILEEQVRKYIDGRRPRKTSKVTKEDIKFQKAQKEFDKNPKAKTIQIEDTKFKRGKNGIVSDKQLSLELDSPVIEDTTPSKYSKVLEAIEKEMQDIRTKAIADGDIVLKADGTFDYALAPNGNRSNLDERQWLHVRTKAFKDWFGDWEKYAPKNKVSKEEAWNKAKEIYNNSNEPYKDLANNVFDLCKKIGIGLYSTNELKGLVGGDFYLEDKSVRISKNYKSILDGSDKTLGQILLHEAIHSLTTYAINNPQYLTSKEAKDAVTTINACYERLKDTEEFKTWTYSDDTYGLKNEKEMIAELANPEFRKLLKKYSLFDKIIDAVKNILNNLFDINFVKKEDSIEKSLLNSLDVLINSFDKTAFDKSIETTLALRDVFDNHPSTIRLKDFEKYIESIFDNAEDGDIIEFEVPDYVAYDLQPQGTEKYEVKGVSIKDRNTTVGRFVWQLISSKKSNNEGFRLYQFKVGSAKNLILEQYKSKVNSVSKVVDENGEPLVVYHGSLRTTEKAPSIVNISYFTTPDIEQASSYTGYKPYRDSNRNDYIRSVFMNLRNPLIIDNEGAPFYETKYKGKTINSDALVELAKKEGYDGFMLYNTKDFGDNIEAIDETKEINPSTFAAFNTPNQIKSATDNIGTYSGEDNNIYHAPDLDDEYFDSEEGIGEEELGEDDLDFSLDNLNQNQDALIEDDLNQEIDENIGRFDEEDEAIREALLSVPNDPFQEIIDNNDTLSDRVNGQVLSELIDQMIWEKKKLLKNYDNHLKALEKLKRKINNSKYLEQKRKYRHLSDKLEEEIKELEEENKKRDAETVLNSIKREIAALQEYLSKDVIDFDDIKIDLLEKRINTLYKYLFGKDIYSNDSDLPLRIIDSSDIELITIKNDLDNIKQEFEKKQEDFVINYAEKDLESRVDDTEKREAIIELFKAIIQNPNLYIEKDQKWMKWLKYVADAEQGLTIFGAVIKSYLEDQKDKFAIGLNRSFLQIKTLENKLKKEDKNYNSTIFLKKDDHGNNTNRLITKYNDNWNVFYRGLYSFRRKYEWQLAKGKYKKYKKQAFENYRNYLLDNADIFQLGEYDEIWEAIKEYDVDNGTNFYDRLKQYKSSTQTHYQEYEKFPSRKHFENDVLQKQIELLTRYLDKIKNEEEDNDVELDLNRDFRNPFVFARDFKTTKYFYEQPASSNYIVLIPKKESYYDKNYNKIASNHDYEEMWALLEDFLMNQLNPLLIENNADIAIDEIPFEISLYNSQYAKNLGWLKRLGLNIYDKSSLTFRQPFYSKNYIHGSVTNKVPVPQSSGSMSINRIKTLYKYADIKTLQDLLNSQKISHYTLEQFLDKNLSQEQRTPYNLKKINSLYRYYLLDLLANASILPHVNQDIVANIGAILDGVSDMAARVETQPFADIVLNILSGKNENHIGSFDNLIRVLRIWVQQNIYANSIADSASGWNTPGNKVYRNPKEDIEHDTLKNITENTDSVLRAFDSGNNHYRLNIILKDSHGKIVDPEEQENILYTSDFFGKLKNHEIHNLTINGKTYSIDVSFLRNGAIITRDQYLDAQRDTFTQSLQDIGTRRTWGNELRGLQSMKVGKDLSINPESGFRNRQEGMYTNIRLAVQGMFSFGEEELYAAKRFLLGIIASRLNGLSYIEYKIAPERYAQLKVYELFTQQLMIFQDHTNLGLSESEKYNLTKFSIEFPETWNQGEVILATLISKDIKIQNNKGEWVPIWDKENNCFNIYDTEVAVQTGKLQLKPEFRTEENAEHWEDFSSEDGYNVNKQLLKECKRNVTRSQGNYENLDKVAATASVAGRTGYTYKRYMYSHLKQRYNHQDIDYLAGDLDVRGMMDVLVEHPQAFFIFMLLNTLMTLKTGPVNVIRAKLDGKRMWLEILRVFFHTSVPLPFAIHMWRKGNHVAKWWSIEESKIALSLLMEVVTRTMSTSINQLTYGKFINKVGKINNFTKNKWARGNYMTEKDRRIMSSSAQQVAGNIHLAIILFGMNIAYKAILESLRDCDTEEECLRKANRMKYYQKLMFFAINAVHQLCIDTARWVDPTLLWNDVSNVSLVEFCKKWFKILTKLQNDDLEVNEKLSYTLKSLPQPFIPNQLANPIMTIGSNALSGKDLLQNIEMPMQDSHVYESYAFDYLIQTNEQERENWYKAFKKETKKYARKYKNRLRKSDNDYSESEIESMVKEFNKTYGKPNGYTKADFLENASKSDYKEWTNDLREASKDVD